ncbi:MAG TPA: sulfotransferase [Acidimicrobiales bacterium]|nr:sulfotransferase [Acidimicrobiales bacterium]
MKPSVLYIGGTGRSGSTLLAGLLGRLDGYVAVGELRYVWSRALVADHLCECGARFRSCPFWSDVFVEAFGGFAESRPEEVARLAARVDRIRHIPRLAAPALRSGEFRTDLEELGQLLRRLYSAILAVSGASVVVDSSKDPSYAYVLCASPSLEVALVHLIRDSRAVAYSWTRPRVRPEIHWKVEYMRRRPPSLSARRWAQYHLLLDVLERRVPRSLRLRYEDLAADPEAAVARIAEVAGALSRIPAAVTSEPPAGPTFGPVGPAPAQRATAPTLRSGTQPVGHSVAGNPLRFEGPRPVRPDLAWVEEMAPRDRRVVTAVTAPLLARYGYLGLRGPNATAGLRRPNATAGRRRR